MLSSSAWANIRWGTGLKWIDISAFFSESVSRNADKRYAVPPPVVDHDLHGGKGGYDGI